MSDENQNIDNVVDELSKPGNEEALDKALTDAFDEETSADDTSAAATPAKTKGEDEVDPIIPHEPSTGEEEEKEEPSKQEAGEADDDSNKQESKPDRFKELLKDRNEAKEEAAAKDQENTELKQQLSQMNEKMETLANKLGQGEGSSDEDTDEPLTKSQAKQMLNDMLNQQKQAESDQQAAEKSITESISELSNDQNFGELAKSREEGLKEIMGKHKSVSAFGALAMKLGQEAIEKGQTGEANTPQNTTKTGSRSKTKLSQGPKKVSQMNTDQMEKYLQGEQSAGQLDV